MIKKSLDMYVGGGEAKQGEEYKGSNLKSFKEMLAQGYWSSFPGVSNVLPSRWSLKASGISYAKKGLFGKRWNWNYDWYCPYGNCVRVAILWSWGLICRLMGLWSSENTLKSWIVENWKLRRSYDLSPVGRDYSLIVCASVAEREWSFEGRLWFMNRVGLYNEILGHGLRLQP